MKILVTGATGYLGAQVVARLRDRGHEVTGLVRTEEGAERLRAGGIAVAVGDLANPLSFRGAAMAADGVVHTAFGHGTDFMAAVAQERQAIGMLIDAYAGTGKRLVAATATGVLGDTGAAPVDESFPGQPGFPGRVRMAVEEDMTAAAARGVRSVVVRPAILVHGHGASQFVPMLVNLARQRGEAGFPGDGRNRLATVHVDDLADLFALAIKQGRPGAIYNGAAGDISTAELAEAIADGNPQIAAVPYSPERAAEVWGPFPAMLLGIENRVSGERARAELGWRPYTRTPGLVEELRSGSYSARAARSDASTLQTA